MPLTSGMSSSRVGYFSCLKWIVSPSAPLPLGQPLPGAEQSVHGVRGSPAPTMPASVPQAEISWRPCVSFQIWLVSRPELEEYAAANTKSVGTLAARAAALLKSPNAHVHLGQATLCGVYNVGSSGPATVLGGTLQQRDRALERRVAVHGVAGVDLTARTRVFLVVGRAEHRLAEVLAEPAVGESAEEVGASRLLVAVVLVAFDSLHAQESGLGHPAGPLDGRPEPVRVLGIEEPPAVPARGEIAPRPDDLVGKDGGREGEIVDSPPRSRPTCP